MGVQVNHDPEKGKTGAVAVAAIPGGSQPIRIMGFVDGDAIAPACYAPPYRLEPGKHDGRAYDLLRDVMQRTRKVGLVSVVIEKKPALAAVIPIGRTLVLNVLRFATGLIPGGRRSTLANRPAPKKLGAKASALASAKRAGNAVVAAQPRPVDRIAPARKSGDVIDLAVRRSSNAAQRPSKAPRSRNGVATLHQLSKAGARGSGQRPLA
ncbi:MAG: Ku protein [Casimicrobiaceae bacterium]